jgi:hypothetical protein
MFRVVLLKAGNPGAPSAASTRPLQWELTLLVTHPSGNSGGEFP